MLNRAPSLLQRAWATTLGWLGLGNRNRTDNRASSPDASAGLHVGTRFDSDTPIEPAGERLSQRAYLEALADDRGQVAAGESSPTDPPTDPVANVPPREPIVPPTAYDYARAARDLAASPLTTLLARTYGHLGLFSYFQSDVARTLHERLCHASADEWLHVASSRTEIDLRDLANIGEPGTTEHRALLHAATLAHDGRVRQAAVQGLAALADADSLPCLVLRLADWVPAIRREAAMACASLLRKTPTDRLLALLTRYSHWLAVRTHAEVRAFHAGLLHELFVGRATAVHAALLDRTLPHRALLVRTWLFHAAPAPALLHELVRDPDATVRCTVALFAARTAAELDAPTIERLLQDRSPAVLTAFVTGLDEDSVRRHADALQSLCRSRRARVRAIARWQLARIGWQAAPTCRLQLVADATPPVGTVLCLGECGTAADRDLLQPLLTHADAGLRAAALTALSRLEPNAWWHHAVRWLASTQPVERAAALALLRRADRWRWAAAVRALAGGDDAITSAMAWRALNSRSIRAGWEVVPDLLGAIVAGHDVEANHARLRSWWEHNVVRGWLPMDGPTRTALGTIWPRWLAAAPAAALAPLFTQWIERELRAS